MYRDLCIHEKVFTRSSPIEDWSKSSTVSWYFGIVQGNGKISYTCNLLILDLWILESGELKFTRWDFCLVKGFLHSSINYRINLISTTI